MKDYTKFMKWAIVYMIDRKTQDDRKEPYKANNLNGGRYIDCTNER